MDEFGSTGELVAGLCKDSRGCGKVYLLVIPTWGHTHSFVT